ncbi:hypothetical protein LI094_12950 [[Clostridium] saccharogumia]|uniref:hypothetical protein n=1 Tax=Thomasclavelia saccharogumia TaxID=341225 RepID=UPI001D078194|nr:hypothetical protein [Thomasclavelia saccharogumia]MCB6707439.1 hypothetical protein [Thomasclavelia saccharogumia]
MADDYKKIIDRINISEQKLDQIKIKILTKKSSKRKLVLYPVIAAIIIAGIMYFDLGLNNDIKTNDNNYFITNIYANSQSYELNDDDITIDMSTDIFGSYWQYNRKRAFLPFDIRVIGHNINKITYEIESGNIDLYRVISLDLLEDNLIDLKNNNNINMQYKLFDQLRESDKLILKSWYNIEADELEEYYNEDVLKIEKTCLEELESADYSQDSIKKYGWLFWIRIKQGKEMSILYNQQDRLNYRSMIYTTLNIDDLSITDQEIKKEVIQVLQTCKIKMLIEYNNGIIKERMITFKEDNNKIYLKINE